MSLPEDTDEQPPYRAFFEACTTSGTLTEGEAVPERVLVDFGMAVADALSAGDHAAVDHVFDTRGAVVQVLRGAQDEDQERAFHDEFIPLAINMFSNRLIAGQRCLPLRHQAREDGGWKLNLRLFSPEGTLDYLDLYVTGHGGQVLIRDLVRYRVGELLTQSVRRQYLLMAPAEVLMKNTAISEPEALFLAHRGDVVRFFRHAQAKDASAANAVFMELPRELQADLLILRTQLDVAKHVDRNTFLGQVKFWNEVHAGNPATLFVSVDAFVESGEYGIAIDNYRELSRLVQGDPFLFSESAQLAVKMGDTDRAEELARLAIKVDPGMIEGYMALLEALLAGERFDAVSETLKTIEERSGQSWLPWVQEREALAGFLASDAGRAWVAAH